jgi:hypothetical protein
MKNKLSDLNDLLFAEMERLGAEDLVLNKEKLENETLRARALCGVSMQILAGGHLAVKAREAADGSFCKIKLPELFGEIEADRPKIMGRPRLLRKDA